MHCGCATLFALDGGGDLDAGQMLPTAAQDALDAVVATAEPAGQLQVRHSELTHWQGVGALWESHRVVGQQEPSEGTLFPGTISRGNPEPPIPFQGPHVLNSRLPEHRRARMIMV